MSEGLRIGLAVVLLGAGMTALCRAGYLQYVALPEEHTVRQRLGRAALALGGVALILGGTFLI